MELNRILVVIRIGRTGRAGAAGMAFSLFTAANARLAKPIKTLLEEGGRSVPAQLEKYAEITAGLGAGACRKGKEYKYPGGAKLRRERCLVVILITQNSHPRGAMGSLLRNWQHFPILLCYT